MREKRNLQRTVCEPNNWLALTVLLSNVPSIPQNDVGAFFFLKLRFSAWFSWEFEQRPIDQRLDTDQSKLFWHKNGCLVFLPTWYKRHLFLPIWCQESVQNNRWEQSSENSLREKLFSANVSRGIKRPPMPPSIVFSSPPDNTISYESHIGSV